MSDLPLCEEDKQELLRLARLSLEKVVFGGVLLKVNLRDFSEALQANGASFVTLTENENLRGCIGSLEAFQPLALDVIERAASAAIDDYRFPPVRPTELEHIKVEISVLTTPKKLSYSTYQDLLTKIQPGVDGIVLRDGLSRATFLPQVWEKLPEPEEFFGHLCLKMGAPVNLWKKKLLEVFTYQVIEFHE